MAATFPLVPTYGKVVNKNPAAMSRADLHKILSRQPGDLGEKQTDPHAINYTVADM